MRKDHAKQSKHGKSKDQDVGLFLHFAKLCDVGFCEQLEIRIQEK